MDEIVDGQFDDAEDDYSDHQQNTSEAIIHPVNIADSIGEVVLDEASEESEGELILDAVEWGSNASSMTKQYMQAIGKTSAGTNPQVKSFHQSKLKKYQHSIELGVYRTPNGVSGRKGDSHVSKNKDKSDYATQEMALDRETLEILYRLLGRVCQSIDGCVSTGKEANVYHATSMDGESLAIKVFKTTNSEFRNRDQYMADEYRFRFNTCNKDIRRLVPKWAEKEFRNLHRLHKAGVPGPKPIKLNKNVLVMEFLGDNQWPAAKLKDATLTTEQAERFYEDCVRMMRVMFQECKLVHADLSEFNMLVTRRKLHIIDVSQSVEMDNQNALRFLKMDVKNVTAFFRKQGVATMTRSKLLEFVMNPDLDADSFLRTAVEDARAGKDADEDEAEQEEEVVRMPGECETFSKDLRRCGDTRVMFQPMSFSRNVGSDDSDDDDDDSEDEGDDEDDDEDAGVGKKRAVRDGKRENRKNKSPKDGGVEDDGTAAKKTVSQRPRDESPNSKKERKKAVKEEKRENRKDKIPKDEKKRRIKISKNKKA